MILFLYGEDTFRSKQKLQEFKAKFKKEVDAQGYNLTEIVGAEKNLADIANAFSAAPFMASKRMIVIEQISEMKISEKEAESAIELIKRMQEDDNIVIFYEEKLTKTDLKKKLFKEVAKSPYTFTFDIWKEQQVAGWVLQELKQKGVQIEPEALQYVSASVGADLWKASLEAKKLIAYGTAIQKAITYQDAKKLVISGIQDDIFGLVDAIGAQRTQEALLRLTNQLDSGSHEFAVLSMIQRQLRILQQVKDGQTEKLHPFVVKKVTAQIRAFNDQKIRTSFALLKLFDEQAKRSVVTPRNGLQKVVTEICLK